MGVRSGYKQTEVGVIPSDWDVKPLGEIGEALIGLTYKPTEVRDHGTLVLRSSNIQSDALAFDDNVFVHADIPDRIMVRPNDVLICVRNGSRDLIGKSALLDERTKGMTFGAFMAVYRSPIGKLASYLFQSPILKRQISEHLGATINQITNKSLNAFLVPVPPSVAEQRAIATALSDVDALLDSLTRLIAKKRDLKQATMQQLLTGQIRLPGFSGAWEVKRLGEIADPLQRWGFTGGPFGSNLKSSDYTEDGVRIIQLQNIGDGVFLDDYKIFTSPTKADELISCNIYPGEIILSKMGDPVARACIIPPNHDRYLMCSDGIRLAVDQRRFCTYFIYTMINAPEFREKAANAGTGSTRKRIGLTELRSLELNCPLLPEQTAIATILYHMDAELSALEARLTKTRALKQAMMSELLTGKTRLPI